MAEQAFSEITFAEIEMMPQLKRAVEELGFEKMTPIQAEAIPVLLSGKDVTGQAQTGTGKTAAFGLPLLEMVDPEDKNVQVIVLCPTRELAVQATMEIRNFAKYMHNVKILPVYGGQNIEAQIKNLKGVQVIIGTPGRIMDHMRRKTIKLDHVKLAILDEADEMLDMGFREDMDVILGSIEGEHQTCLFSATMPQEILDLAKKFQKDPVFIKITKQQLTIDSVSQYYYPVKQEFKTVALMRLLAYYNYGKCMVFCNTKGMVDELVAELQKEGYQADGLHGDLSQKQRDYVMGRFRNGGVSVLIATDIAARGIDVGDVEAVFNYDIPQETEYYVHRIGRTGRAGKEGESHTIARSKDFRKIREIEQACHCTMQERHVPSADEIKSAKENGALKEVLSLINKGHSGKLIPVVKTFCEENNIPPELFAAALLNEKLGENEEKEYIDVNLPSKDEKKRYGKDITSRRIFYGDERRFGAGNGDSRRKRFGRNSNTSEKSRKDFGESGERSYARFHESAGKSLGAREKTFAAKEKASVKEKAPATREEAKVQREKGRRELQRAVRETSESRKGQRSFDGKGSKKTYGSVAGKKEGSRFTDRKGSRKTSDKKKVNF